MGVLCLTAAAFADEGGDGGGQQDATGSGGGETEGQANGLCCTNVQFGTPGGSVDCGGACPLECPTGTSQGQVSAVARCDPAEGFCGGRKVLNANVPDYVCLEVGVCMDSGVICEYFMEGSSQATEAVQASCTSWDTPCGG